VMPRGALTSSQGGDDAIRKAFLDDDVIECIIDLPGQLFFNTQIPSSLWFFNRDKRTWKNDRAGQVLFIDARNLGVPISRNQIEFSDSEIAKISDTFMAWAHGEYENVDWFCKSVNLEEIRTKGGSLSPGRYIETGDIDEDLRVSSEALDELTISLAEQITESNFLEQQIRTSLKALGYEI
jgi:type I restriction enzyme M protein